jgi:hypothetical protein
MDHTLTVLSVIAGCSGWAAIGAWWFRERTKSVRAMKALRRRNDRLQRAVIFTLAKWREQIEHQNVFLAIEAEYADRLARDAGVSANDLRTTIRAVVEARIGDRRLASAGELPDANTQRESVSQVQRYVETGEGTLADLEIITEIQRVA